MRFVELFVQGVVGFPPSCRIPLGDGHVVVRSPVPLLPLLRTALYWDGGPDGLGAEALAAPGAAAPKIGLLLHGRDGASYRLIRELRGGLRLHRWDEAKQAFAEVTAVPAEVGTFLRSQIGVPSRAVAEGAFWLSGTGLPSAYLDAAAPPRVAPVPPAPPPDAGAARATLERLARERRDAERVERLQARLDELTHEQAGVARRLEGLARASAAAEAAKEQYAGFQRLAHLPSELEPLLDRLREAERERDAALARLEDDRAAAEASARHADPPPLHLDWRFSAAAAAGAVFLGLGAFTRWPVLALLDVPAFGVAAALAYRYVDRLQAGDSLGRRRLLFDERARKVHAVFAAASVEARAAMETAGAAGPDDLAAKVRARDEALERLRAAEGELAALEARPEFASLHERARRVEQELRDAEEELQRASAGTFRPVAVIDAEIAELEARLSGAAAPAPALGGLPGALLGGAAPRQAEKPREEPPRALLAHAAELLSVPRGEIAGRLGARASAFVATLTDRRLGEVELSPVAGMAVASGGARVPWAELPAADRDLAWLALQLAVLEQFTAKERVPVVFDEPFGFLSEAHQLLVARLLQTLGKRTQVLHRTALPAFAGHADSVAACG